jgi:hypothetical protein
VASGARCYVVLVRNIMKGGHRETENLTASPTVVVAASRRPLKARVDGGGDGWRERRMRVRLNPRKRRPKHKIGDTYGSGETRQSLGSRRRRGSRHRNGRATVAMSASFEQTGKREDRGVARVFIGGRGYGVEGRERGTRVRSWRFPSRHGRGGLPNMAAPLSGREKEGGVQGRKGKKWGRKAGRWRLTGGDG